MLGLASEIVQFVHLYLGNFDATDFIYNQTVTLKLPIKGCVSYN